MDELLNCLLKIRKSFSEGVKEIKYDCDTKQIIVSSKEVLNIFDEEKTKFKEIYFWGVVKGEQIDIGEIEIKFLEYIENKNL